MSENQVGEGSFLQWENHSWPFSSYDNSGGLCTLGDDYHQMTKYNLAVKKPLLMDLSSSSPTPTATPAPTPTAAATAAASSKRGRASNKNISSGKGGISVNVESKDNECSKGSGGHESDHEIHIWTERERRKKMRNMFSNLHALLPQLPAKADKSTIVDEAVNYIKTLQHTLQKLQKQKLEMLRGAATIEYEPSILSQTPSSNSREAFLADQVSSRNLAVLNNVNNNSTCTTTAAATTTTTTTTTNSSSARSLSAAFPACLQTWSSPNVVLCVSGDDAQISVCATKKAGLLATVLYVLEKHKLEVVSAHISSDYYRSMYMIHAHANRTCDQFQEALTVEEIYKLAVGEIIFLISSLSP